MSKKTSTTVTPKPSSIKTSEKKTSRPSSRAADSGKKSITEGKPKSPKEVFRVKHSGFWETSEFGICNNNKLEIQDQKSGIKDKEDIEKLKGSLSKL